MANRIMSPTAFRALGNALLLPVKAGRLVGEAVTAAEVFSEHPVTVVFVVRCVDIYCVVTVL